MHLKLVVLFAVVAACSARSILGFNGCFVNIDQDNVVIRERNGRQVDIFTDRKSGVYDKIKIHVNGPNMNLQTFEIDDYQVNQGEFLSDVLLKIFAQFAGDLNGEECDQLLKVIEKCCETGEVHPVIFHCLKFLCYQDEDNLKTDIGLLHYHKDLTHDKLCSIYGVGCGKFNTLGLGYGSDEDKLCRVHGICGGLDTRFDLYNKRGLYDDKMCRIFGVGCNQLNIGYGKHFGMYGNKMCQLYGIGCGKFTTGLGKRFDLYDDTMCRTLGVGCNKFNKRFDTYGTYEDKLCREYGVGCGKFNTLNKVLGVGTYNVNDDTLCRIYGVGCNKFGRFNKLAGFGIDTDDKLCEIYGIGCGKYTKFYDVGGFSSPYVHKWWNKGFGTTGFTKGSGKWLTNQLF